MIRSFDITAAEYSQDRGPLSRCHAVTLQRRTDSLARAAITSPSADRDLLMACASFSCSPALPLFFTLQQHHRGSASAGTVSVISHLQIAGTPRICGLMHRHHFWRCSWVVYRSEPARSTKLSLPRVTFCVCRFVDVTMIDMIRWLRLDSRFICTTRRCKCQWYDPYEAKQFHQRRSALNGSSRCPVQEMKPLHAGARTWVAATWRFFCPASMAAHSCLAEVTSTTVAPGTVTMPLASFLISSFGCLTTCAEDAMAVSARFNTVAFRRLMF